jgi:hypothetical protein
MARPFIDAGVERIGGRQSSVRSRSIARTLRLDASLEEW